MEHYIDKITEGDCLEVMEDFQPHSIDMILCDLPYELTQNRWDTLIDLGRLWALYKTIIKPGGAIVLTAQGRFTGQLIASNLSWFKYKIIWVKSHAGNFLNAGRQPLRKHEDVCIFYNSQCFYEPQKVQGEAYDKGIRYDTFSGAHGRFKPKRIQNPDGSRFPSDVLFFEEDDRPDWVYFPSAFQRDGTFHPAQKPVDLGRWLIRTYSRPGELILDNTCGSGSFLVAAALENRRFIGIEKNDRSRHFGKPVDYVAVATERIAKARACQQGSIDNF